MNNPTPDFQDLRGLTSTVRKFAAAVQRGERILLIAAPGSGATALAQRAVGLLPEVVVPSSEARAIDAIREAGGFEDQEPRRPFRAPHHTVSWAGMVGQTRKCVSDWGNVTTREVPGELELAKHGVLLLDQAPEFSRNQWGAVGCRMSADTLLIATAMPCACGWRGSRVQVCTCTDDQYRRYRTRLAYCCDALGIETTIEVPHTSREARAHGERCPSTSDLLSAGGNK